MSLVIMLVVKWCHSHSVILFIINCELWAHPRSIHEIKQLAPLSLNCSAHPTSQSLRMWQHLSEQGLLSLITRVDRRPAFFHAAMLKSLIIVEIVLCSLFLFLSWETATFSQISGWTVYTSRCTFFEKILEEKDYRCHNWPQYIFQSISLTQPVLPGLTAGFITEIIFGPV